MFTPLHTPRTNLLCVGFCVAVVIGAKVLASPQADTNVETKVGQGQLIAILKVPTVQKELELSDDQVARIAAINEIPLAVTFAEAIAPLKTILTDEQLNEFKRTALRGLMVRAFHVAEVRETLELTPEQMTSIAAIQAKLKTQVQPFQDKLKREVSVDPIKLERDTAKFHEDAYEEALKVLTTDQVKKWEQIAKPLPLRDKKGG